MRKVIAAALLTAVLSGTVGCAPRLVTRITGTGDTVKLVYNRNTVFGFSTGIVACERADTGELGKCNDLAIDFKKKNK